MTRIFSFTAGALAILATACANSPDKAASNPRTNYRARDTQVGSHIPRSYTDPNETASTSAAGGAGDRAFVGGSTGVVGSH